MNRLTQQLLKLHSHNGYSPDQYFQWMLDDCLAAFGVKIIDLPPEKARDAIFEVSKIYGQVVRESAPFSDVLGDTYQELASQGHKKHLGQYFTPMALARMMALMTNLEPTDRTSEQLIRVCDPACGSGVMALAFAGVVAERDGIEALRHYSFSGIDLDRVCARMAPLQLLAAAVFHGDHPGEFCYGELCFYQGNALRDPADLNVVFHATRDDLPAQLVVPAKHPVRLEALREVAKANAEQLKLFA